MGIKTRLSMAINLKTWEPEWGVDVNIGSGWMKVTEGNSLYITPVKEEAQNKRSEIKERYKKLQELNKVLKDN